MNKTCSKKVIGSMIVIQVLLATFIFSHMLDFNIFNVTNITYLVALGLVLFAIGFFAFSFKSCLCKENIKNSSEPSKPYRFHYFKSCSHHIPNK